MKKYISILLIMTLMLALGATSYAIAPVDSEADSQMPPMDEGGHPKGRPDLSEILADDPDTLATIEAIFDAIESGEMSREAAKEALAAFDDILPPRPQAQTQDGERPQGRPDQPGQPAQNQQPPEGSDNPEATNDKVSDRPPFIRPDGQDRPGRPDPNDR